MRADNLELAVKLSEGNPGAMTVLGQSYQLLNNEDDFNTFLTRLQNQGISGPQIWIEYKDKRNQNIAIFVLDFWGSNETNLSL